MGESAVSYLKVYYEELNALWYSSSGGDMFLYALTGVSLSFYREHYHVFPNDLQANLAELSPFCTNFLKRTYRCVRDMSWDANAGIELYHKAPVFVSSLDLFTDIILDAPELALGGYIPYPAGDYSELMPNIQSGRILRSSQR